MPDLIFLFLIELLIYAFFLGRSLFAASTSFSEQLLPNFSWPSRPGAVLWLSCWQASELSLGIFKFFL